MTAQPDDRRRDDLGRAVIPKEIRRTMCIRESDRPQTTSTVWQKTRLALPDLSNQTG